MLYTMWFVVVFNFQIFGKSSFLKWWVPQLMGLPPPPFRRPVRSNGSHLQWCGRMRRKFALFLFSTTFLLQIRMEVVWLVKQSCPWWCIWDSDLGGCFSFFLGGGGRARRNVFQHVEIHTFQRLNHCWTTFFYTAQLSMCMNSTQTRRSTTHCHQVEEGWGRHILLPWLSLNPWEMLECILWNGMVISHYWCFF